MTPKQFAAWRKRMGYSYTDAADALGISRRQVIRYEKGEKPEPGNPSGTVDVVIPRVLELACKAIEAGLT